MKRFIVVIPKSDGGVEVYPMKEWLRQHPDEIPTGLDGTFSTSHQLRDGLKKRGWFVHTSESEVRLTKSSEANFEAKISEVLGDDDGESEQFFDSETAFGLEYQLRDFLAQNLDRIPVEGKILHLYVDPTGRDGVEFPTAVGPIDILAVDESGDFVVFELKRARSPDHAIGQLTRYMGWIKQTIGRGRDVRGVIVARTISENLRYSISVVPQTSLFEYEVSFQLKTIPSYAPKTDQE